jgi:hypothetical protein
MYAVPLDIFNFTRKDHNKKGSFSQPLSTTHIIIAPASSSPVLAADLLVVALSFFPV